MSSDMLEREKIFNEDKMKKIILNQNYANALKNDIIGAVKKEIEEEKKFIKRKHRYLTFIKISTSC